MMIATGIIGGKTGAVVFTGHRSNGSSQNNYTFSNVNFGPAAPGRKILVATVTFSAGNANIASLMVGGVTPTLLIQHPSTGRYRLYLADLPTGETGAISVSYSGPEAFGVAIMVWAAYDLKSSVPVATRTIDIPSGTPSGDLSINALKGGVIVAATGDGANGTSTIWNGLNEDIDQPSTIDNWQYSGASVNVDQSQTPRPITLTSSNTSKTRFALAASFR